MSALHKLHYNPPRHLHPIPPKVAAIAPWNWGGCPTCNGSRFTPPHTCCMDEIGTKDQPLARAAWIKIGKEIKQAAAEATAAVVSNLWA